MWTGHRQTGPRLVGALLAILATLALVGCVTVAVKQPGSPVPTATPTARGAIDRTPPEFALESLDGDVVALSDLRGRPIVVNFWASWCPPCRDEFPVLAQARLTHADSGLEILGIIINDQPRFARAFVEEQAAEWPMLQDPAKVAWEAFGGVGLPTTFFVDAEGVIQDVSFGPLTEESIEVRLATILPPSQ